MPAIVSPYQNKVALLGAHRLVKDELEGQSERYLFLNDVFYCNQRLPLVGILCCSADKRSHLQDCLTPKVYRSYYKEIDNIVYIYSKWWARCVVDKKLSEVNLGMQYTDHMMSLFVFQPKHSYSGFINLSQLWRTSAYAVVVKILSVVVSFLFFLSEIVEPNPMYSITLMRLLCTHCLWWMCVPVNCATLAVGPHKRHMWFWSVIFLFFNYSPYWPNRRMDVTIHHCVKFGVKFAS